VSKGLISICVATAGVALLTLLPSAFADAPPPSAPLRVELSAPPGCPASPDLLERVRRHTPRVRGAHADEPARSLRVHIAPRADRLVAELRLVDGSETLERQVPGRTCEEVLAAVALITAFAIDPLASATPRDVVDDVPDEAHDAGTPDARPPPPLHVWIDDRTRPAPVPEAERLHARVGVALEAHGLGQLVLGRSVWMEGWRASGLAPSLRLRLAQTRTFTVEPEGRPAFFALTTAAFEGCVTAWSTSRDVLQLRPCVAAAVGALEGASSAFGPARATTRPWASLGGRIQTRWSFWGPLALELGLGLTLPLVRDDFFFLPRIDVYRAPAVVLLGDVGIGTTFR
jgi:hypothetical protein